MCTSPFVVDDCDRLGRRGRVELGSDRGILLVELQNQYVTTARATGVPPFRALMKYPLRMALNPFISDIGSLLPHVV